MPKRPRKCGGSFGNGNGQRSERTKKRLRFAAERLEERRLLSGANDPALVQAIEAGLTNSNPNGLAGWSSKLSDTSALGQDLAVIGTNFGSHYSVKSALTPILNRLTGTYTTVTDLQTALNNGAGLAVNAIRNNTDNIEMDLEFQSTTSTSIPLATGKDIAGPANEPFNSPFDLGGSLQVSATLDFKATVGAYWDSVNNQAVFYLNASTTNMSIGGMVSATNLNASAHLGFLDVNISNGQVSFSPQFTLAMNDPNPAADNGRVTTSELTSTPISTLMQTTVSGTASLNNCS